MNSKLDSRIPYIDSIKGIAALLVVFCHWACAFMPGLYDPNKAQSTIDVIWRSTPLNIITNGVFSVQLFFALSGILITKKIYSQLRKNSFEYIVGKFGSVARLAIPGIFFAFILMKCGLMINVTLAQNDPNLTFFLEYNNFSPTIKSVFIDIVRVFFKNSLYNGPLWTLHHELLGSILIACVVSYILQYSKNGSSRSLTLLLCSIPFSFLDEHLSAFFFGAFIYDLYIQITSNINNNILVRIFRIIKKHNYFSCLFTFTSIYLACINRIPMTGIYTWIPSYGKLNTIIRAFGVSLIMLIILTSNRLQCLLIKKRLIKLGRISPYIYIFHWPILESIGCILYRYLLNNNIDSTISSCIVLLVALIVTLVVSWLYYRIAKEVKKRLFRKI